MHVHAEALSHAPGDRQRPRGVHLGTEGGVERQSPVADLVPEALDDDRAVVGQVTGGGALLLEVGQQVVPGPLVQAGLRKASPGPLGVETAVVSGERAARQLLDS